MNGRTLNMLLVFVIVLVPSAIWAAQLPSTPVVLDGSAYTLTPSIHASWSATHPNGIDEYVWRIGEYKIPVPNATGWMSAGQDTEATFQASGEIERGAIYYVMVKARSGDQWSTVGYSDGIVWVRGPAGTIALAKSTLADGYALAARPVTAVFADRFYIEEPDRSMGIMVRPQEMPPGLIVGNKIEVAGGTFYSNGEHGIAGLANICRASA